MTTVLVTCVGSGVGQSVIDSLNMTGKYRIIGVDMNPDVYAYNFCHEFLIAPGIYSDEYVDFIIESCLSEKVDVVVPGHDYELLLFSKNMDKFKDNGIKVIVSLPDIIEVSRNKFEWYEYFNKYGCLVVPTFYVSEFKKKPDAAIYPAIVKPTGGSASQGIQIISDAKGLENVNDSDVIQPYLFPLKEDANYKNILKAIENNKFVQQSEISVQLIFTTKSEMAGIFISKNILKGGVPMFVDTIDPEKFEHIDEIMKFADVLAKKNVVGPVNLQGRITDKGFVFFEMNMRFTGITGTRAKLGFNEVDFLIKNFLGKPAKLKGYTFNKLGVRQVACLTKPRTSSDKKKNYAVLGAGGFIGSYFVHELIKKNDYNEIYLICREASFEQYKTMYASYNKVFVLMEHDDHVLSKYCMSDVLVNFASARASEADGKLYESMIFQYRQSRKLYNAGIPLVINVSSQSVYNQKQDMSKNESAPVEINNLYAFQKYLAEEFFQNINESFPANTVISLRLARVIGVPHDNNKPQGFFARVIEALQNNELIDIPFPENKINLIDIRDAINAIFYIIENNDHEEFPTVLNLGGTNISIREYCKLVIDTLNMNNKKSFIRFADTKEVKSSAMINDGLFRKYHWAGKYTLADTIQSMNKASG